MSTPEELADGVQRGDIRSVARLISAVERGDAGLEPALERLHPHSGEAWVIGVTGPPGAGKSSMVDALVTGWRAQDKRVAILAVDPSSPFGGGAILGDRVRMQRHSTDPMVFVRSMSARGAFGGLARAAGDALRVLEAAGFDIIVIETVGVGQTEVEIAGFCSCVLLLQAPSGGDMVQAIKSGIIEIGSVMVVSKPTIGDPEKTARYLRDAVHGNSRYQSGWTPPVVIADCYSGDGMEALHNAIQARFSWLSDHPDAAQAEAGDRLLARALSLVRGRLESELEQLLRSVSRSDPKQSGPSPTPLAARLLRELSAAIAR